MRKDLTSGSLMKNILDTAMPMIAALLLQTGFNVVDAIYVGRLSAEAIAAVSLAFPIMFFVFAIAGGIGVGATSLISRYIGAGQLKKADNAAEHALLVGGVLSFIFTIFGLLFGKNLVLMMGGINLVALALSYLNPIFIGTFFLVVFAIANSILRGEGDTRTPMMQMIAATLVNIVLDPIFIFALDMGVKGAAIATVIANMTGFAMAIYGLTREKSSIRIRPRDFKFDISIVKNIFKIGVPSSLSQVSMSVSLFIMTRIVSYFGSYAIAAFGISFRLDSIAILPALGLMMSVIPIVGQNVGANKFERAEKTAYMVAAMSAIFTGIVGVIFFAFPRAFISIFNTHPEVIGYGVSYLGIVPLAYAFIGIGTSMSGAFLGAGDPLPALITTLLRVIILVIPLALLLAFVFDMGMTGIWLAYAVSIVISGTTSLIWFKTGRWKKAHHLKKEEIPEVVG